MNKLMLTAALALAMGAGAASAQEFVSRNGTQAYATLSGDSSTQQQAPRSRDHSRGVGAYSAFARNVGPGSTVGGFATSDLVSANAGNPENPLAPSAGGLGLGGQ